MLKFVRWLTAVGVFASFTAGAETAYVSDTLIITVRAEPSTRADSVAHLRTGDAVEVLERREQDEFVRVRTDEQIEGWALAQYLMSTPAARTRMEAAERAAEAAEQEAARLTSRTAQIEAALASTSEDLQAQLTLNEELGRELESIREASANAVALRATNAELGTRLQQQEAEIERLIRENAGIDDASKRDWFLVGAGVLIIGILLGLLLPRLRRRRGWDW